VIRTTCRSYVEFFESFEYSSGVKSNTSQGWINCSFSGSGGQLVEVVGRSPLSTMWTESKYCEISVALTAGLTVILPSGRRRRTNIMFCGRPTVGISEEFAQITRSDNDSSNLL